MPEAKQNSRRQVRVRIFVLASVVVLAAGIFIISGQAGFTPHYQLKVFFSSAGGLRNGAQVRLDGILVGNVRRIAISSYPEPDRAVEIDMDIDRKFQRDIRSDSVATMQTTGLLGETYVDISRGAVPHEILRNGGVLQSKVETGMKEVMENTNGALTNFRGLGARLTDVTNHIQHGKGSVGEMVHTHAFSKHLDKTVDEAQKLINKVNKGHGTLAEFVTNGKALHNKTVAAADHVNQIIGKVQGGKGAVGEFVKDHTLLRSQLNQLVTNTETMEKNINSGKGTLGKLATDRQFHHRISDTMKNFDVITTRMAQGKGTLGHHSTNSQLLQSLNSSVKYLKEFFTEFRKSPRKYMTLHFHIF